MKCLGKEKEISTEDSGWETCQNGFGQALLAECCKKIIEQLDLLKPE
jgi:hypothetical protein